MLRGDQGEAIATAEAAIALARLAGSAQAEAHALTTLGTSTVLVGRSAEGLAMLRDAFVRTKALTDAHDDMGRVYANLSSALVIAGRAEESVAVATEGVEWARSVGAAGGYGRFIAGNLVDALVHLGRWDEAERWLEDQLDADAVGVNRLGLIGVAGAFHARRGHLDVGRPAAPRGPGADRAPRRGAVHRADPRRARRVSADCRPARRGGGGGCDRDRATRSGRRPLLPRRAAGARGPRRGGSGRDRARSA